MLNHQRMITILEPSGRSRLRWITETEAAKKIAQNVAAMHRVHRASLPKKLHRGCFAVWSPYGTIPVNSLITWRLERFEVLGDAQCAFLDRITADRDTLLPCYFVDWGRQEMPLDVTPLSRLWVYRFDPRDADLMPSFGYELGPRGGLHRVVPDTMDDELRHIVMAEDMYAKALAGTMVEGTVF